MNSEWLSTFYVEQEHAFLEFQAIGIELASMNSKVVHSIWVLFYNACHYSRSCHCHLQQEKVFEDLMWNLSFPTILLASISHLSFTWNALVLLG